VEKEHLRRLGSILQASGRQGRYHSRPSSCHNLTALFACHDGLVENGCQLETLSLSGLHIGSGQLPSPFHRKKGTLAEGIEARDGPSLALRGEGGREGGRGGVGVGERRGESRERRGRERGRERGSGRETGRERDHLHPLSA